jgi:hypothetical protein
MADSKLKAKIYDVLKRGVFNDPDDLVDVSDGPDDGIHVVVVSRKFDGKRMREKNDLIWAELTKGLKKSEWKLITLSVGASPEEVKAT